MSEFEGIDLGKTDFSDFEKAMEDAAVKHVAGLAKQRAHRLTIEEAGRPHVIVDENTQEFDSMTVHVMDSMADVSGTIQVTRVVDGVQVVEGVPVQEVYCEYKGFIASRRDGNVEYDFVFQGFVMPDETLLTRKDFREHVQEGREDVMARRSFHAKVDDVYINFDRVHPIRALAWLSISHPEIIEAVDRILLDEGGDDASNLLGMKEFSYLVAKDTPEDEKSMIRQALAEYVRGMASVDYEVPYMVDINGAVVDMTAGYDGLKKVDLQQQSLFSATFLDIYEEDVPISEDSPVEGVLYKFGLIGTIHADELDGEFRYALIPLECIERLQSNRLADRLKQPSGETA